MSALPKPQLRGYFRRFVIRAIASASVISAINSSLFFFLFSKPRREKFAEYRRTMNEAEQLAIMKKYNYLESYRAKKGKN